MVMNDTRAHASRTNEMRIRGPAKCANTQRMNKVFRAPYTQPDKSKLASLLHYSRKQPGQTNVNVKPLYVWPECMILLNFLRYILNGKMLAVNICSILS